MLLKGVKNRLLTYKSSQISYYCFGSGPKPALCFHGYAEQATMFAFLEKQAGNQYTFIAIDLPFHGQTQWNEGLTFTDTDLQQITKEILGQLKIQYLTLSTKLTLIGFSLGGRVALSLYQLQPQTIEKIVLLAPDGLKVNFWYWLSTRTWIGNRLFAFTMEHPRWFFAFLKLVNRTGMVNASVFKFVNYYIGKKDARIQLYERWTSLRKLKPDLTHIKSLVRQHKTPVRLIYGQHDRIILPVRGEQFKKGIEEYTVLRVIESGHQVLHEKHADEIILALIS